MKLGTDNKRVSSPSLSEGLSDKNFLIEQFRRLLKWVYLPIDPYSVPVANIGAITELFSQPLPYLLHHGLKMTNIRPNQSLI